MSQSPIASASVGGSPPSRRQRLFRFLCLPVSECQFLPVLTAGYDIGWFIPFCNDGKLVANPPGLFTPWVCSAEVQSIEATTQESNGARTCSRVYDSMLAQERVALLGNGSDWRVICLDVAGNPMATLVWVFKLQRSTFNSEVIAIRRATFPNP